MAGEIRFQGTSGLTLYALIVDENGNVWSGTALVATSDLTDVQWTASLILLTEEETSEATKTGLYLADWPSLTQLAVYSVQIFTSTTPGSLVYGYQDDPTEYTTNSSSKPPKNTALANFPFLLVLASDNSTAAEGYVVTSTVSIDGAAFSPTTNSVVEVGDGIYKIDLSASDMNGDTVCLQFTATDVATRFTTILTQ